MLKTLPPATRAILVANVLLFALYYLLGPAFINRLALSPVQTPEFEWWQLITYSFMHEGFLHLFFNMFALYMFGRALEAQWGARNFLIYYFASVLAAAATQLVWTTLTHTYAQTVGASGGVFGVLLAFALLYPRERLMLLFPPIPMPAWLFVTLYGVMELFLGVTNSQAGVAHFAHLGGMLGGALVFAFWRTLKPARQRG
jgi:membrane associated rhomboid family serine protease